MALGTRASEQAAFAPHQVMGRAVLSPEEWFVCFESEKGHPPKAPTQLQHYVQHRGGHMTYRSAREAFAAIQSLLTQRAPPPEAPSADALGVPRAGAGARAGAGGRGGRSSGGLRVRPGGSHWFRVLEQAPEGTLCAICLDDEEDGDRPYVELRCGNQHRFHRDCIEAYMTACCTTRCPTCRQTFLPPGTFENVPEAPMADARYGA